MRLKVSDMPNPTNVKLDAYDRRILSALQRDGRLTNVQLADEIGLSASPCLRRVRHLEEAGVIRGYQATLIADALGLGLTVFIGVKVDRHHEDEAQKFHQIVSALPEVISAYLVSGESDFLLHVVVPDLRAYDQFLSDTLLKMPSVRDIRSNFAIRTLKPQGPLPLGHLPV
jgi:Lrp/AsnC family leucine-responsive transcriptional regulator